MHRIELVVAWLALILCLGSPQNAVAGQEISKTKLAAKKGQAASERKKHNREGTVTDKPLDMPVGSEPVDPYFSKKFEEMKKGYEEIKNQCDELKEIFAREAEIIKENKALKFELETCKLRLAALNLATASEKVADHQELNVLNDCNQNRLHIAIRSNNLAEASRLIKAGINLNQADQNHPTPIKLSLVMVWPFRYI